MCFIPLGGDTYLEIIITNVHEKLKDRFTIFTFKKKIICQVPSWTLKQIFLAVILLPVNTDHSKRCLCVFGCVGGPKSAVVNLCTNVIKMLMWTQYKAKNIYKCIYFKVTAYNFLSLQKKGDFTQIRL